MPGVQAFSSFVTDVTRLDSPTVGELAQEVTRRDLQPFVLHVERQHRSILLHPGQFEDLRRRAVLEDDQAVLDTGLFDALGEGQLNVSATASPAAVLQLLEVSGGSLAVVMGGPPNAHSAVGVFVPASLLEDLPQASLLNELPNGRHVAALADEGNLVGALRLAEASFTEFHSESINQVAPRPLQCRAAGGHFVGRCPCRYHAEAPCLR